MLPTNILYHVLKRNGMAHLYWIALAVVVVGLWATATLFPTLFDPPHPATASLP